MSRHILKEMSQPSILILIVLFLKPQSYPTQHEAKACQPLNSCNETEFDLTAFLKITSLHAFPGLGINLSPIPERSNFFSDEASFR